jgi:hypothetical protein
MKKLGKLTESWMQAPEEPKYYPLVSDTLFEGKVKRAKKKIKEDDADLPMNKTPEASKMTTNRGPKVDPGTYQTYNSMTDGQLVRREAKDDNWIQGAEKDIERRGTKGKCTPITKPGCTGKAKALAKTFKKMAKKRDAEVTTDKERKDESSTPKPIRQARARAQAGKPIKKGTAKMVANDPGQDLDTAVKAGDKLS